MLVFHAITKDNRDAKLLADDDHKYMIWVLTTMLLTHAETINEALWDCGKITCEKASIFQRTCGYFILVSYVFLLTTVLYMVLYSSCHSALMAQFSYTKCLRNHQSQDLRESSEEAQGGFLKGHPLWMCPLTMRQNINVSWNTCTLNSQRLTLVM